jgi:hypothetical protein
MRKSLVALASAAGIGLVALDETSFSKLQSTSELRAVLIVAAVLALGILTKLDSSIQLFHLSH